METEIKALKLHQTATNVRLFHFKAFLQSSQKDKLYPFCKKDSIVAFFKKFVFFKRLLKVFYLKPALPLKCEGLCHPLKKLGKYISINRRKISIYRKYISILRKYTES